jgi:hypothetical protein
MLMSTYNHNTELLVKLAFSPFVLSLESWALDSSVSRKHKTNRDISLKGLGHQMD